MVRYFFGYVFLLLFMFSPVQAEGRFRFIVLDVGEGQAVLVQRGKSGILLDTGHFGKAYEVVKSIKKYGVEEIEHIFLSHLHPDHASGIFTMMENFPKAIIYETGHRIPFDPHLDGYRWVAEALDEKKWDVIKIRQGDVVTWRGVTLSILWPPEFSGSSLNGNSLVITVKYGENQFLIMGDAGQREETLLLQEKRLPSLVQVLVVGHHGAHDATSTDFLQWVRPEHGVISVNGDNKRGYPDREVIANLEKLGTHPHLTSEKGDFVWSFPITKVSE